jgi:hypothetical protein
VYNSLLLRDWLMEMSRILSAYKSHVVQPQALPPQYQEAREKEAIRNDPRFTELLGNVKKFEIHESKGSYIVMTDLKKMQVDVVYLPSGGICGPAKFELLFHQPTSR